MNQNNESYIKKRYIKQNRLNLTLIMQKTKILVIGAGPAGLSTLKALNQLPQDNLEITCIQKQPEPSGQWNYTWKTTTDKYGEHVHSGMYSQLWTNIPKEAFQFPDYTFKEHFGKSVPSYLPREVYKGYFMKRFQRQNLQRYVKFNCSVRNVHFIQAQSKFQVRYTELDTKKDFVQLFDYVVVAVGLYSYPNLPQFPGIQLFKGRVAHSHQLRDFGEFKDKNVLVIGGSHSAEDVTLQCYKYGAKSVTWTYRTLTMKYNLNNFPKNIQMIPKLSHFDQENVYFENAQKRQIQAVLLCTGYIHNYPFMEQNLRLQCKNPAILWPQGLYFSVAWQKNPKLFYVGSRLGQITADIQGYLVRQIISGKHILPADIKQKRHPSDIERVEEMKNAKSLQDFMNSGIRYVNECMKMTDYPSFDITKIFQIFKQSVKDREENFLTYRDVNVFQSVHTGQWSCKGNRSWLEMKQVQSTDLKGNEELKAFFQF